MANKEKNKRNFVIYFNNKEKVVLNLAHVLYFQEKKGKLIVYFDNNKNIVLEDNYKNLLQELMRD